MPTGYTYMIEEGISFKDFVMGCARAMGALVMMREDPSDKPIPERFEPSDFYLKTFKEKEIELINIKKLTLKEIEVKVLMEYNKKIKDSQDYINKNIGLKEKYQKMLMAVQAWNVPSPDHKGLQDFMIQQLETSIEHDCDIEYTIKEKITKPSAQEWRDNKIHLLLKRIADYKNEHLKEVKRVEGRNLWIKQLRESLE